MDLLYFVELFGKAIDAAEQLIDEPGCEESPAIIDPADMAALLDPARYCNKLVLHYQGNNGAWDCFPRHLTQAEYFDPYLALEKCFKKRDSAGWKEWLMGMLYASARNDSHIEYNCTDTDVYRSIQYAFKLLEAFHLVYVRERKEATVSSNMAANNN